VADTGYMGLREKSAESGTTTPLARGKMSNVKWLQEERSYTSPQLCQKLAKLNAKSTPESAHYEPLHAGSLKRLRYSPPGPNEFALVNA